MQAISQFTAFGLVNRAHNIFSRSCRNFSFPAFRRCIHPSMQLPFPLRRCVSKDHGLSTVSAASVFSSFNSCTCLHLSLGQLIGIRSSLQHTLLLTSSADFTNQVSHRLLEVPCDGFGSLFTKLARIDDVFRFLVVMLSIIACVLLSSRRCDTLRRFFLQEQKKVVLRR